jgi:hypothetical protein
MEKTIVDIYNEFLALTAASDEAGARKLIIDNYMSLPVDVQGDVLLALVTEAADKARQEEVLHDLRTRAIAMLEKFEKEGEAPAVVHPEE